MKGTREPGRTKSKKKYEVKHVKKEYACPHCDSIFPFEVAYCDVCKMHVCVAVEGYSKGGICHSCETGLSRSGQAKMRAERTWNGVKGIRAYYDWPEFYDGEQEISNMTVMPLWVNNEVDNIQ